MTKHDYTMYIYKTDKRYRSGERPVSTTVWRDRTEAVMEAEIVNLRGMYPSTVYRIEYFPTQITAKSLMTGQDIEIDRDTPWSCNPASESFWSN
jgi:hypothetical protein